MPHIQLLPLGAYQTNCYIAWGENADDCIIIDPGYTPERVLAETERLGKRIAAVLLTHGHFDHVGGVREIVAETGCAVYLHEKELTLPPHFTDGALYYTHFYGEGDTLSLAGLNIRVLHTPGHTPGSVCLQVDSTLFAGDTLFFGSIGRTDFPGSSPAAMQKSLQRLKAIPEDLRVLPGHGEETTLSYERQYNPYL